jgi:hypothetical protein
VPAKNAPEGWPPTTVVLNHRQVITFCDTTQWHLSVRGCKAHTDGKATDSDPERNPSCSDSCPDSTLHNSYNYNNIDSNTTQRLGLVLDPVTAPERCASRVHARKERHFVQRKHAGTAQHSMLLLHLAGSPLHAAR